jgi:hypothetical protein
MATGMAEIGIPESTISKVLNHSDPNGVKVTKVYNRHAYDAEKRDALDRWGRHLSVLVSGLKVIRAAKAKAVSTSD